MGLKHKLNLLSINFTIIVILLLGIILYVGSNHSFYYVEDTIFIEKLETLRLTFEKELYDLEYILRDWAEWDLTYDFVNGARPNYIDENFGDDILSDLDLNYIYIFDEQGRVAHSIMSSSSSGMSIEINESALDSFSDYPSDTGLLMINNQLVLFSSMGISDNEGIRQPSGFMGFARIVDETYIDTISMRTGLPLTLTIESGNTIGKDSDLGPYGSLTSLTHTNNLKSVFTLKVPIKNSNQTLVLEATSSNAIQELGSQYVRTVLLLVVLILGVFGFLLNLAFSKLVLNRLLSLNDQIAFIRNMRDTKERLPSHGDDEIGELSENINLMLEELDSVHSEISKFATFDEMTGVYNRRVGLDILEDIIQNAHKNGSIFSVIYIDVDGLKSVNDLFGHSVGDSLIKDSINLIIQQVPDPRYIVRLGGDEFLIILKNHTYDQAKKLEQGICDSISNYNKSTRTVYTLSLSMGIIEYKDPMELEDIIELADEKMYKAKQKKKASEPTGL